MNNDFLCCVNCNRLTRRSGSVVVPPSVGPAAQAVDGRLPKHTATFLAQGIAHCPHCGLSAPELEDDAEINCDLLRHPDYLAILKDTDLAAVPRHYLAHAWLNHAHGRYEVAFESALCAAWYCDDFPATMFENADICRRAALGYLHAQQGRIGKPVRSRDEDLLLTIDLIRRLGEMAEARRFVRMGLELSGLMLDTHRKLMAEYALILGANRGPCLLNDMPAEPQVESIHKQLEKETAALPGDEDALPEPRSGHRPLFHFSGMDLLRYAERNVTNLSALFDIVREAQHRRRLPPSLRGYVVSAIRRLVPSTTDHKDA